MAILAVPFTTIYLVAHSAGGAILHVGGQYVAGTLIPASVVGAANTAAAALAGAGSSAMAIASSPVVVSAVALTAAVAGTYCYFFGIPAPIEGVLIKAGLATPTKAGLAITAAKMATALIILGAAGLLAFNVYQRVRQARAASRTALTVGDARGLSEASFGPDLWQQYGEAVWEGGKDTVDQIVGWAKKAADGASKLLEQSVAIGDVLGVGATAAAGAGGAAVGAAYAAGTVTILGSSTLGGIGLSLGLVSAPLWPVIAGGAGAAGLGYVSWKLLRSSLYRARV